MGSKLIEIASFGPYDAKRYGRPWLAKLKGNPGTTKLTYDFQESAFAGDPENGGKLMGHLNDGDYISYGQKDFRGECTIQWTGVYSNGELKPISKADIVMTLCSCEKQDF